MAARNAWISVWLSVFFSIGGCKSFECIAPEQSDNITVITESCQLTELLNEQTWLHNNTSDLAVTGDIQISGSVTVSSYCFDNPFPQCEECVMEEPVVFDDAHGGQGITIVEKKPILKQFYGAQILTLTDIKLRFRKVIRDGHPAYGAIPTIVLVPPTDQLCADGQKRCSSDQVCYSTEYFPLNFDHIYYWKSYCLSCENLSPEECECRDAEGVFLDNGTNCGYGCSADNCDEGICQGGACVPVD